MGDRVARKASVCSHYLLQNVESYILTQWKKLALLELSLKILWCPGLKTKKITHYEAIL